ncbi:MAG: DNA-binding protein [Coleofasciculus sp. D1-CHI-01]|uniref:DNA-binding protein n=1 Tax=Coleofasciculus sp. D1-CHI-01 TaxID=3068482 RepID=UPI0032FD7416
MIVGTTQAAQLLNISTARLRALLLAGRVEGAYKTGKMWLMPLFNGKPIIKRGTRGPTPRWRNPRKPAKTIIHVNSQRIRSNKNKKDDLRQPVITVKKWRGKQGTGEQDQGDKTSNTNVYGHEVEIPGGCRVIYRPDNPICGAQVWIETRYDVRVISWQKDGSG